MTSLESAPIAQKAIHKRRQRRFFPIDLVYIPDGDRPTNFDVVARLGCRASSHPGNRRFLHSILTERPTYRQLGKDDVAEKNAIAETIYNYIVSTGGRFLQLDRKTQKFFHVPKRICLNNIRLGLKDRNVPLNSLKREPTAKLRMPPPPPPPAPTTKKIVPSSSSSAPTYEDWELGHAAACDRFEISIILSSPCGRCQHPGARGHKDFIYLTCGKPFLLIWSTNSKFAEYVLYV